MKKPNKMRSCFATGLFFFQPASHHNASISVLPCQRHEERTKARERGGQKTRGEKLRCSSTLLRGQKIDHAWQNVSPILLAPPLLIKHVHSNPTRSDRGKVAPDGLPRDWRRREAEGLVETEAARAEFEGEEGDRDNAEQWFFSQKDTCCGASRGRCAASTSPSTPSTGRASRELVERHEREGKEIEETHLLCGHDCCGFFEKTKTKRGDAKAERRSEE